MFGILLVAVAFSVIHLTLLGQLTLLGRALSVGQLSLLLFPALHAVAHQILELVLKVVAALVLGVLQLGWQGCDLLALRIEGAHLRADLLKLEILPLLDCSDYLGGQLELLAQLLQNVQLVDAAVPAQTPFLPLPGVVGQEWVELMGPGPQQRRQEWGFSLVSSLEPVVVDSRHELTYLRGLVVLRILLLEELGDPVLVAGQGGGSVGLELKEGYCFG